MLMGSASIKDKILKCLVVDKLDSCKKISDKIKVPRYTVYTLMQEMHKDGHIEALHTTTIDSHDGDTCVGIVKNEGRHFYYTTSYAKEARKVWLQDVPKKYWLITALFAVITFALPLYLQYCSRLSQSQSQSQPLPKKSISDTTKEHLISKQQ
jgi:predicted transcriptional regulator